ncbi:ABC transporter ATP-binding protein, partial [Coprobacillus cateniformis]|nr:ABC transporter ATP-binding protein [Coprobacillus cateniformis]
TFVIAHRLSTIKNAKRICVLTEKGIEEEGTHEELLERQGQYAYLYNMQFNDQ